MKIKDLRFGEEFTTFEGDVLTRGKYNRLTKRYHCINFRNRSRSRYFLGDHKI